MSLTDRVLACVLQASVATSPQTDRESWAQPGTPHQLRPIVEAPRQRRPWNGTWTQQFNITNTCIHRPAPPVLVLMSPSREGRWMKATPEQHVSTQAISAAISREIPDRLLVF